jgi:hypothetical protein
MSVERHRRRHHRRFRASGAASRRGLAPGGNHRNRRPDGWQPHRRGQDSRCRDDAKNCGGHPAPIAVPERSSTAVRPSRATNQSRASSATSSNAPGFGKQVGRAGHDRHSGLTRHRRLCAPIQFQHNVIIAAHDQQCRCGFRRARHRPRCWPRNNRSATQRHAPGG